MVRSTRYTCDYSRIFGAVVEVVTAAQPPLAVEDPGGGLVASAFRWHEPTGMRKHEEAGRVRLRPNDLGFYVHVALRKTEGGFLVEAYPHVIEQELGSPRGRELTHEDADWPAWADGKVDKIAAAIHERLKECAGPPN